jgi:hypothetical protein
MNIATKNMNKMNYYIVLTIILKHIKIMEIQRERDIRITSNQALDDVENLSEDMLASL